MKTDQLHPALREIIRVAPARLAWGAGLRAAAAIMVPLILGRALGNPGMAWAALGGFNAALVDKDGSYSGRAWHLAVVSFSSALAAVIAALLGHAPVTAIAGMAVWTTCAALGRAWGRTGQDAGTISSVTFAVSLATAATPEAALMRAVWLLAGSGWAALIGLLLWPLRRLRPAQRAVGQCYAALGAMAREVAELARAGTEGATGRAHFDGVRTALEAAWRTLPADRSPGGRSTEEEVLLLHLHGADQALGSLAAYADAVDDIPPGALRDAAADEAASLAAFFDAAGARLMTGRGAVPHPEPSRMSALRGDAPEARHLLGLAWRVREFADAAHEALEGRLPPLSAAVAARPASAEGWLAPLRGHLSLHSVLLRHALRAGIVAAAAVAVAYALRLEHGYWVTATALITLQPQRGTTLVKGLQRMGGTALGATLAIAIPHVTTDPHLQVGILGALAVCTVAMLPVNYLAYTFLITPTFVLLAEMQAGLWNLSFTRVIDTLIGGVIALAGAHLLWAPPERRRFPEHAATAAETARDYLLACLAWPRVAGEVVAARRRAAGLMLMELSASLDRARLETGRGTDLEPAETISLYLRRLVTASSAAAAHESSAETATFGTRAADALSELSAALSAGREPGEIGPLLEAPPEDADARFRLERLERPIRVLHDAAGRLAGAR